MQIASSQPNSQIPRIEHQWLLETCISNDTTKGEWIFSIYKKLQDLNLNK